MKIKLNFEGSKGRSLEKEVVERKKKFFQSFGRMIVEKEPQNRFGSLLYRESGGGEGTSESFPFLPFFRFPKGPSDRPFINTH